MTEPQVPPPAINGATLPTSAVPRALAALPFARRFRGDGAAPAAEDSSMATSPAAPRPTPRLRDNRRAFDEYGFVPRVLNDVSGREQTTTLFGKTYASPFGIPPMGSAALCAYRGDIVLTRAAAAMNVPMILSASSLITLEDVRRENPAAWYQAYLAGDDLAHRAAGRPRRRGRLRHLRRHRRRAGAAEPREQHPQRLSGAARDHAAGRLGHGHASALAVRHLGAHPDEPRHAAFREHGRQARPAGAGEKPDAQHRRPRPARLEACRADPQPLEGQARRQGPGLAGGCAHRARERRRRRDAVQPWRPPARLHDVGACARCRRSRPRRTA